MIALSFYFRRRSIIGYRPFFTYTLLSAWILHMEWRTPSELLIPITHGLVTIAFHFTHSQRQLSNITPVLYSFAVPGGLISKHSCQSGIEHANRTVGLRSGQWDWNDVSTRDMDMNSIMLRVGRLRTIIRLAGFLILPFCVAQVVQRVFSHWIACFTQVSEEDEEWRPQAHGKKLVKKQQGR
jgi:hypothetical protein